MLHNIDKKLIFSKREDPSNNNNSPKIKKVSSNIYCEICGRTGHYGQACAASIQIFEWRYPAKGDVYLCGDFSHWQRKHLMHPPDKDRSHTWLQLSLAPSKYEFKFLVDGQWCYDVNATVVPDGMGNFNNQIEVIPAHYEESEEEDDENPGEYSVLIQKKDVQAKGSLKQVRVTYPFDANWVSLKGSWDDWSNEIPLKKIKNNITGHYEFYVKLRVAPGVYEYKFLVNGQWMIDPSRKNTRNSYGKENNVLNVKNKMQLSKLSPTFLEKNKMLKWERLLLDYELPADFKHLMQGHSMSVIGDEVYVFGGQQNKDFTNTMYMLDLSTYDVTYIDQGGPIPVRRAFHSSVVFYNKIIIYGGFNEKNVLTDYHVFNTANKTWLESPMLGGELPHMRERFSLVPYHEQNLLMFGGYYCSPDLEVEEHYNDLHALNLGSLEWHKIECEGDIPPVRFSHTASIINNGMYIFGGISREKSKVKNFNDVYLLKIRKKESKMQWRKIEVKGTPPEPRHGHTAVVVNTNILFCSGRGASNKLYADVHILDTVNAMWFQPEVAIIGDAPKPRFNHTCQLLSNQNEILLFGGYIKDFTRARFFKLSPNDKGEEDSDEDVKSNGYADDGSVKYRLN